MNIGVGVGIGVSFTTVAITIINIALAGLLMYAVFLGIKALKIYISKNK